jgi:cyclic pyranopterin phosphate synthase
MPSKSSHLDEAGRARMVDVGDKPVTAREAEACGLLRLSPEARAAIVEGRLPKGDALAVARIAGIQAAKRCAELIPLCHPLPLAAVEVRVEAEGEDALRVVAVARARWHTGVEMEALVAASTALLALYDMAKSIDRGMVIEGLRLLRKSGGRSGDWQAP